MTCQGAMLGGVLGGVLVLGVSERRGGSNGRLVTDFDDYTYSAKRALGNVKIAKKFDGVIGRTVEAFLRVKIYVSSYLGSILEKSIRRFKAF